jgi:hypothetical protein
MAGKKGENGYDKSTKRKPVRRNSARYTPKLAVGSFIILEQLGDGTMVKNIFPKIGGRLRLAHEKNDQLSISTEVIKYDESLAVKISLPGKGMAAT